MPILSIAVLKYYFKNHTAKIIKLVWKLFKQAQIQFAIIMILDDSTGLQLGGC